MNHASSRTFALQSLRCALFAATTLLSACAYLQPESPSAKPVKLRPTPAVVDTQQKDRARQALQKATASSNEYSACVMFSTSTHRASNSSATDIAAAACGNCATKLDEYEKGMIAYYEGNPIKPPGQSASSAQDRAHERRMELEQTTRQAAIQSLAKTN